MEGESKCVVCGNEELLLRKLRCDHELCSACIGNIINSASEAKFHGCKRVLTFACPFCRAEQLVPRIGFFGFEIKDESNDEWQVIASHCSVCNVSLTADKDQSDAAASKGEKASHQSLSTSRADELREFEAAFDQPSFSVVSDSEGDANAGPSEPLGKSVSTKEGSTPTLTHVQQSQLDVTTEVNHLQGQNQSQSTPKRIESASFCAECRKTLCSQCAAAHVRHVEAHAQSLIIAPRHFRLDTAAAQSVPSLSLHSSIACSLTERRRCTVSCDVHTGRAIELYCRPCATPLCQLCVLVASSPHRTHEVVELSSAEYEIRQLVRRFDERSAKPSLATSSARVEHLESNLRMLEDHDDNDVESYKQAFERTLTQRVNTIKDRLDNALHAVLNAGVKEFEQLHDELQSVTKLAQTDRDAFRIESLIVNSIVESDSLADLARLGKQIRLVDSKLSATPIRSNANVASNCNSASRIRESLDELVANKSFAALTINRKVLATLDQLDAVVSSFAQQTQNPTAFQPIASLSLVLGQPATDYCQVLDVGRTTVRCICDWADSNNSFSLVFGLSDESIRFLPVNGQLEALRSSTESVPCRRGVPCALRQVDKCTLASIEYRTEHSAFYLLLYRLGANGSFSVLFDSQVLASRFAVDCFLVLSDAHTLLYAAAFTNDVRFVELSESDGRCAISTDQVDLADASAECSATKVEVFVKEPRAISISTITSLIYINLLRICVVLDSTARKLDIYSHSVGAVRLGSVTKRKHELLLTRRILCDSYSPCSLVAWPTQAEPALFLFTSNNASVFNLLAYDILRGEHVGLVAIKTAASESSQLQESMQASDFELSRNDEPLENNAADSDSLVSLEQTERKSRRFHVPLSVWHAVQTSGGEAKQLYLVGWDNSASCLHYLKLNASGSY